MKYACIDYGTKWIGLAISDEGGRVAAALDTLRIGKKSAAAATKERLETENVEHLVISHPLGLDSKPTAMSKQVDEFIEKLSTEMNLPYTKWNETYSSQKAASNFRQKHNRISTQTEHAEAARILLQEFLDFKQTNI